MTKIDIADKLAKNDEIVITKKNAKILVDLMFNIMEEGLREEGIITVPGFFVFEKKLKPGKQYTSPFTKETTYKEAHYAPKCRFSKKYKDLVASELVEK